MPHHCEQLLASIPIATASLQICRITGPANNTAVPNVLTEKA